MGTQKDFLQKLKKGDAQAFRQVVEDHKDMVFATAFGFVHDKAEAEDIAQEVFVEVFNSIKKFKGDSKISTWIYRITVNKSINALKKIKRIGKVKQTTTSYDPENENSLELPDEEKNTPDALHENQERREILESAVNELPENQKTAFVLHKYDGLAYKQISEIMETSLSSVESLLHRAKSNLQKKLVGYYRS
ncbi:MAG: RNA polymerase sigma factor [Bacteroidales bacterium]|nr:RNA polymerase sigma factor [Bacteroidales bacterium]MCF8327701.1 RNA polymerase sigma factor [Bacteroidales bacterium]